MLASDFNAESSDDTPPELGELNHISYQLHSTQRHESIGHLGDALREWEGIKERFFVLLWYFVKFYWLLQAQRTYQVRSNAKTYSSTTQSRNSKNKTQFMNFASGKCVLNFQISISVRKIWYENATLRWKWNNATCTKSFTENWMCLFSMHSEIKKSALWHRKSREHIYIGRRIYSRYEAT